MLEQKNMQSILNYQSTASTNDDERINENDHYHIKAYAVNRPPCLNLTSSLLLSFLSRTTFFITSVSLSNLTWFKLISSKPYIPLQQMLLVAVIVSACLLLSDLFFFSIGLHSANVKICIPVDPTKEEIIEEVFCNHSKLMRRSVSFISLAIITIVSTHLVGQSLGFEYFSWLNALIISLNYLAVFLYLAITTGVIFLLCICVMVCFKNFCPVADNFIKSLDDPKGYNLAKKTLLAPNPHPRFKKTDKNNLTAEEDKIIKLFAEEKTRSSKLRSTDPINLIKKGSDEKYNRRNLRKLRFFHKSLEEVDKIFNEENLNPTYDPNIMDIISDFAPTSLFPSNR